MAAHPIAGTEYSGPDAAVSELYKGKTIMLCDTASTRIDLLDKAKKLFSQLEMNIREMDPVEHDKHIAYVFAPLAHHFLYAWQNCVGKRNRRTKHL